MQRIGEGDIGGRHSHGPREAEGEPPEPHGEHHEQKQPHPKRRRGGQNEAVAAHEAIEQPPLAQGRRHAQDETEHAGGDPGDPHEGKRVGRPRGDDLGHGRVVAQGHSQIAMQKVAGPSEEALEHGRVGSPVGRQRRPLLLAHGHERRLAHVRLQRIHRREADQRERHHRHRHHQKQEPPKLRHDVPSHGTTPLLSQQRALGGAHKASSADGIEGAASTGKGNHVAFDTSEDCLGD